MMLGLLAAVFIITIGGVVYGLLFGDLALVYSAGLVLVAAIVFALVERRNLTERAERVDDTHLPHRDDFTYRNEHGPTP